MASAQQWQHVVRCPKVSSPTTGQSHDVYQLEYPGGQKWSLRIARNEFAVHLARRGMAIAKHAKQSQSTLQIPKVKFEAEKYTLLEYLNGNPIGSWNSDLLSKQWRHKVLDGLALFLFRLWSGPTMDADAQEGYRDWLLDEVDKAIRRSLHNPTWGSTANFIQRRAKIDELVPTQGEPGSAIRHGDLNAWNMLVDDSGFVGVIDWDTAQFVPTPAAVQYPLFIADIPGWRNDNVPEDMFFKDDRMYLDNAVRKLAVESGSHMLLPDLLASSWERWFFKMSLRNKRINEEYARLRLEGGLDGSAMSEELERFFLVNETLREDPAVLSLQNELMGSR